MLCLGHTPKHLPYPTGIRACTTKNERLKLKNTYDLPYLLPLKTYKPPSI
jgi:hypothetical protein